jgi:hypothetical protein
VHEPAHSTRQHFDARKTRRHLETNPEICVRQRGIFTEQNMLRKPLWWFSLIELSFYRKSTVLTVRPLSPPPTSTILSLRLREPAAPACRAEPDGNTGYHRGMSGR